MNRFRNACSPWVQDRRTHKAVRPARAAPALSAPDRQSAMFAPQTWALEPCFLSALRSHVAYATQLQRQVDFATGIANVKRTTGCDERGFCPIRERPRSTYSSRQSAAWGGRASRGEV